ncbi:ABC transporter ATP-binding protein [Rhizobium panacihumi]|uniref:ABC transporter ATP-binding protein n=1 Tax=Rhizobium panacihumi TaxID=2008450 RepID=UPI003D7B583F
MHQNEDNAGVPHALEVTSLSHAYGPKKALDDVSFSIPAGRFTVLLGLNGAGKTTLFSLISRLYDTRDGSIRIFGRDIRRDPGEALRRLGIVFQARTLDLDLTVAQNLAYHAALHGFRRREAMARIGVLLDTVGLADRLHDKAKNLSGGQMRRVEIVRAMLHRPSLLLLDEATVGLDIRARADILATIRALVAATGLSVLWATHLIDEVEESDDVVILDHGRVLATGRVADVVRAAGSRDIAEAFAGLVSGKKACRMVLSPLVGEMSGRTEGGVAGACAAFEPSTVPLSTPLRHLSVTSPPQGGRSESDRSTPPDGDASAPKAAVPL